MRDCYGDGVAQPAGREGTKGARIDALIASRARFLAYIRRKVRDDDLAEDLLQDALLRAIRAAPQMRDEEALVPWFYRVLDNAIVDAYRRRAAGQRLEDALRRQPLPEPPPGERLAICECFRELLPTLKPEYSSVIEALDLAEIDAREFAASAGVTPNNLKVRRHRARQALRRQLELTCRTCAEHHCLDCTCK
jgi:RNA polymerase sigma-70 factor (ECF subfamily)